ncbi:MULTISPECIES: glucose-6-phosphate dehydrogenase [unclassified Paenibacillus]|uniref:glucose-6-phosphate dehydrogenase n=1 Tax=unclassified Paenibacillus TaxID=185978 RepID=UPI0024076334|nr:MULTISPECIES: glucose-6-phosphate dehydrogenase [unclassified Paenibacillus]MDF9844332.1 glucose-6-phosphate 1-dehydrogenase [Paenibacillus sp. PastF-2]MDF9850879.1 glucose-6-phosphate 1-dehydrogenase [Paenibacillus sp. PastM-2]MDF9857507.1 glucose-6-phosphate 1-dehydrogenase [Paenibacillus sp. PastF-1]MDH6482717.1 glucose-6-phosphate 1-dehydrogenase [Paenibacillus sp. PastH-2]MDH6510143.1 glucose-6-phosphate 1-dehydrogenase [Paenibacillus sp. PastM-3]
MAENQTLDELHTPGAVFFIFGATGDLARRKLFPALYSLYREGKLTHDFAVIGVARRPRTQEEFREDVKESIREFCRYQVADAAEWNDFVQHFEYKSLDINNVDGFRELSAQTELLEQKFQIPGNRMFYLALAPELFGSVSFNLKAGGMLQGAGWNRLVIEKPFGYNLESAEQLNEQIRQVFKEEEIYRIDHYLGKEMVQNIEVIRFANAFFEPLWNNKHIANIQITLGETVGVEERGGYYDHAGALRDMGQNHILQLLTMIAMEPPSRLLAEDIRDEKVKVLRSLRPYSSSEEVRENVVRGQYTQGLYKGKSLPAYRQEDKVDPESNTETYFAARIFVDNFRWAGVPFYIRTGKRLPVKTTEVVVEFKGMPTNVYLGQKHKLEPNLLVIRVNPMEGIYVKINAKKPGSESEIQPLAMDFCQSCMVGINSPEAYERLLHDAARGDSTYFTRWDEVSSAWSFVDRIAQAWKEESNDLASYPAGSWGPVEADQLLAQEGFHWWPVNGQDEDNVVWRVNS